MLVFFNFAQQICGFFNLLKNTTWWLSLAAPKERLCKKTNSKFGSQLLAICPGYHGLVEREREWESESWVLSMTLMLWLIPFGQVPSTHWFPFSNWNKGDYMRLVGFKFVVLSLNKILCRTPR